MNNKGNSKILITNNISLGKRVLNTSLVTKMMIKLSHTFIQRSGFGKSFDETKQTLFSIKDVKLLRRFDKILDKSNLNIKNDLIVNQSTMKNT